MYGLKKYAKKILCGTLAAAMTLQMAAVSVTAQESGSADSGTPNVLFEDNFDSGSLREEWQIPDTAEVDVVDDGTGNYVLKLRPVDGEWGTSVELFPGKTEWQNYSVETDFVVNEWIDHGDAGMKQYDNIGLAGHSYTSPEQRWEIMYRRASQTFELNKYHYSSGGNKVEELGYELELGKVYKMKLTFEGEKVSAYVAPNGEEYGNPIFTTEQSNVKDGGIRLSACGAEATFDNVKVEGIETTIPVEKVELDKTEMNLEKGEKTVLNATVTPSTVSDKSVTWSSSNEEVAIVDKESGMVTAQAEGTAVITATSAADPSKTASCTVTVYETAECSTFYYVSTTGSDENPGTEEAPFATVQKARDTIRQLETLPEGGITVYLRGGEYYQDESITFTPEDSGEAGKPIVYTSYPGEQAVITGGKEITGWTPLEEEVPYMSEEAKGNLYVTDIETGWRFHDLYVDGERQQISQQMETKQFRTWPQFTGRLGEENTEFLEVNPEKGIKVRFEDGELDGLTGNPDIEIDCMTVMFWNALPQLTEVNEEDNTAYLYSYNPSNLGGDKDCFNSTDGGWYNILNDIKYLDQPGEWCVDSRAGKVYYWPKDKDFTSKKIVAPKPYELFRFQGDEESEEQSLIWEEQVEYITLDNLVIEYSDRLPESQFNQYDEIRNVENPDATIFMQGAANCKITNCVVQHSGSYGVTLSHYAQNIEILGNELGDLGSGGVNFSGYGPGFADVNKNNTVMYNNIHDLGVAPYRHTAGVSLYQSGGNTISYNYISDSPYAGVTILGAELESFNSNHDGAAWDFFGKGARQFGFRWGEIQLETDYSREESKKYLHSRNNVVEYNILDEYMTGLEDGGGLYAWGCGYDNRYANNIIIKTEKGMHWTFPLYMDDKVDRITVEHNLVWSMEQGTIDKGYGSNTWVDNKFSWPEKPEGYEELKAQIINTVETMTGKPLFGTIEKATLLKPDDQTKDALQPLLFSWKDADNASRYKLEVATDSEFTNVVYSSFTEDTQVSVSGLDWGNTYYWRVGSCVMAEPVVYSDARSIALLDGDLVIKVEAENFAAKEGMQLDGPGLGYIGSDCWAEYNVSIPEAGEYMVNYRIAANANAKGIAFTVNDTVLATTAFESTGGWQNWVSVSDTVTFAEPGEYTVRLNMLSDGFNFDYFELLPLTTSGPIDKTALKQAISNAEKYNEADYTKPSWAVFADALAKANEVNDNAEATQAEVDAAVKALEDAIAGLEKYVAPDKTLLQMTYEYALNQSTEGVTDSAKKFFEDAVAAAEAVLNDSKATQEEVDSAWENLVDAIHGLGLVQGDKSNLKMLIEMADEMVANIDKYVSTNWQQLVDALAEAKDVYNDGDAMEEDIQPAADALLNAILAQRFKANKSNLEDLINKAESIDLSQYTEESVTVFRAALMTANLVLTDDTLSEEDQDIVDTAAADLKQAMDNLEKLSSEGNQDESSTDSEEEDKDNSNSIQKPSDENSTGGDQSKNPSTGDSNHNLQWIIFGFAVVELGVILLARRRRAA